MQDGVRLLCQGVRAVYSPGRGTGANWAFSSGHRSKFFQNSLRASKKAVATVSVRAVDKSIFGSIVLWIHPLLFLEKRARNVLHKDRTPVRRTGAHRSYGSNTIAKQMAHRLLITDAESIVIGRFEQKA